MYSFSIFIKLFINPKYYKYIILLVISKNPIININNSLFLNPKYKYISGDKDNIHVNLKKKLEIPII